MKKTLFSLIMLAPFAAFAQKAVIRIDTERAIGEIDPNIYGVFMEPIGRNHSTTNIVIGPLYNPESPTANADGFNTVIIDAMKELKITNMRWPGGNYISSYNWQDGIGPKAQRPVRKDLAWGGFDTNQVGTDEWVALNRAIGNEMDGEPWINDYKNAEDYCKIGLEAIKAMKNVDNTIKTVVCGSSSYYEPTGKWLDWNRTIINAFTGIADYLSIHRYWDVKPDSGYYKYMGDGQLDFESKIQAPRAQIQLAQSLFPRKAPLKIAVDEWAAFGTNMCGVMADAMCLNSFIRNADVVKRANFTMMTSLLSNDREKGFYKSPLFYAYKLYSNNCRGTSIDTYVQCDTFNTATNKGIPYLDVTSVYNKETVSVFVNVVNRSLDKAITTDISNVAAPFANSAAS